MCLNDKTRKSSTLLVTLTYSDQQNLEESFYYKHFPAQTYLNAYYNVKSFIGDTQ